MGDKWLTEYVFQQANRERLARCSEYVYDLSNWAVFARSLKETITAVSRIMPLVSDCGEFVGIQVPASDSKWRDYDLELKIRVPSRAADGSLKFVYSVWHPWRVTAIWEWLFKNSNHWGNDLHHLHAAYVGHLTVPEAGNDFVVAEDDAFVIELKPGEFLLSDDWLKSFGVICLEADPEGMLNLNFIGMCC